MGPSGRGAGWRYALLVLVGIGLATAADVAPATIGDEQFVKDVSRLRAQVTDASTELPLSAAVASALDARRDEGTWFHPSDDRSARDEFVNARVQFDPLYRCGDTCEGWRPGSPVVLHVIATDVDLPADACAEQGRRLTAEGLAPREVAAADARRLDCSLEVQVGDAGARLDLREGNDGTGLVDLTVTSGPSPTAPPVPAGIIVALAVAPVLLSTMMTRWRR